MVNYNYLYNKDYYGDKPHKDSFKANKLHFKIIENGTALPHKELHPNGKWDWGFGGIVDENGQYLDHSFVFESDDRAYTPTEEIQNSPETVIYFGMTFNAWGHLISDCLKRAWFFKSEAYKKYFSNCKIIYTTIGGGVITNFIELLKILDIDIQKFYHIDKPIKFKNIILPDVSFVAYKSYFFTNEYLETIEQVRYFAMKNKTPINNKKLYFYYGRHSLNEMRLVKYFQSKGYVPIIPENLSTAEQLNLLINCESFASTIGSCAHNMIFTPNNSEIILIPRVISGSCNRHQNLFDQMHEKNIVYIDATFSVFAPDHFGPYFFVFSKQLKEYFGETWNGEYTEQEFEEFLMYVKFAISHGLKIYDKSIEYYGKYFAEFIYQLKKHPELMEKYGVNIG